MMGKSSRNPVLIFRRGCLSGRLLMMTWAPNLAVEGDHHCWSPLKPPGFCDLDVGSQGFWPTFWDSYSCRCLWVSSGTHLAVLAQFSPSKPGSEQPRVQWAFSKEPLVGFLRETCCRPVTRIDWCFEVHPVYSRPWQAFLFRV